jgi:hypothetical protein
VIRGGRTCSWSVVLLAAIACAEDEPSELSIGLTTDLALGFDARSVEVEVEVDGLVVASETFESDRGGLPALVAPVPVDAGSQLAVRVTARDGDGASVVTRLAETVASSGSRFLPMSLDRVCVGISCGPGETCASGSCVSPFVDGAGLDGLDPSWLADAPDACREGDEAAWLELGVGETSFAALATDQVVALEPGPQGGHHVWLAVRAYGVRQVGSTVTVRGELPSLAISVPELQRTVSLRRADAGACQLWGLRFQVDRGVSVEEVVGQPLVVGVTLEDATGRRAEASGVMRLSASLGGA